MKQIEIETSARHVHVTVQDLETLFGKGYKLTKKKDVSQPGQFAAEERVDVVGPKKTLSGVTILGPERAATQVELSLTDARSIGIAAPVRESGDIAGTPGCTIVGPAGQVTISQGVIAAKRHVHLTPAAAAEFGLKDNQIIRVKVTSTGRAMIFDDVVARVSPNFAPFMHIDTDESNAAGCAPGTIGEIVD
ncbi:MAG: phosphate propanoyltransferase [Oscillospiraceae bacterium]|nr:phosphate propanoyltransferase [Oscillospiraceae bacterium]